MSIRAYIVRETLCGYTEKEINNENHRLLEIKRYEDIKPLFNVWHHPDIFSLIAECGYDCTNCDQVGEIGISEDDWDTLKEDGILKEYIANHTEEEKEILQKIDIHFKKGYEDLILNCY